MPILPPSSSKEQNENSMHDVDSELPDKHQNLAPPRPIPPEIEEMLRKHNGEFIRGAAGMPESSPTSSQNVGEWPAGLPTNRMPQPTMSPEIERMLRKNTEEFIRGAADMPKSKLSPSPPATPTSAPSPTPSIGDSNRVEQGNQLALAAASILAGVVTTYAVLQVGLRVGKRIQKTFDPENQLDQKKQPSPGRKI